MDTLFAIVAGLFIAGLIAVAYPTFAFFVVVSLVAYVVYNLVYHSRWLDRMERRAADRVQYEQAKAESDKRLQEEQAATKLLHDTYATLPTVEQYSERLNFKHPTRFTVVYLNAAQTLQNYTDFHRDFFGLANMMGHHHVYQRIENFKQLVGHEHFFEIPEDTRQGGAWVIAPSRRGKTNLLHCLIAEDRTNIGTVIIIDSKGELLHPYRGLPDVVVIDAQTARINPLQIGERSMDFLVYIFSSLIDAPMTRLQQTLFRPVLKVLVKDPNSTLETFRDFLTNGWKPYEHLIRQCDKSDQDFFFVKNTGYDDKQYNETKGQVLWRLKAILDNDMMRNIFASPETNVPFGDYLDSGKLILIDNNKAEMGDEGSEFFGRYFIALLHMAAVQRSRPAVTHKPNVWVYIDECHTVIKNDAKIVTILDECGSQNIKLLCSHQRLGQISEPVLDALANCAIRIANSDDDAAKLAPRFRYPVAEADALRLPKGRFMFYVRDHTPRGVVVNVPLFDTSQFPPAPPKAPPQAPQRVTEPPRAVHTDEVEDF